MQTLKCSVDVNVLEAQNDIFLEPKIEWQKKTFVSNKSGNLLISTELKKKETYVVLAFPCELDANVFKWVLK